MSSMMVQFSRPVDFVAFELSLYCKNVFGLGWPLLSLKVAADIICHYSSQYRVLLLKMTSMGVKLRSIMIGSVAEE